MSQQVKDFCERLNIEYHEELNPYYEKGLALYKEKGLFAIDKERITSYHNKYNIFRKWFDDVIKACDAIKGDEDLIVFIYTLVAVIEDNAPLSIIPMPNRESIETDHAPLFSLLYFLEDMVGDMERRGLPHEVISDTLYGFDSEMNDYYSMFGRSGVRSYVGWFLLFVRKEIIRVGRFQMQFKKFPDKLRVFEKDGDIKILIDGAEVHKKGMLFGSKDQDDEAGKYFAEITEDENGITGYPVDEMGNCVPEKITIKGYKEILKPGDDVISVHIPSDGPLDYEYSEKSYEETMRIVKEGYPEYDFKAFTCWSWLMAKEIMQIMGRDTNITRFSNKYLSYPINSQGTGVYAFLYNLPGPVDPKDLPERSSMHTLVKKFLMEGNTLYERGGIRLF